jgi:hypothetical protein
VYRAKLFAKWSGWSRNSENAQNKKQTSLVIFGEKVFRDSLVDWALIDIYTKEKNQKIF